MRDEMKELEERILVLEETQAFQLQLLKEQVHITHESLKPINLIKNILHDTATSPEFKKNFTGNVVGITSGYLSRKILLGTSHNPIKKLLGALFQFAVGNFVSQHTDTIGAVAKNVVQNVMKKREAARHDYSENGG